MAKYHDKVIVVKLPEEIKNEFKKFVGEKGMSEMIREMIVEYVEEMKLTDMYFKIEK